MPYTIRLRPRARRALDRLSTHDSDRVIHALQALAQEPRPRGVRKLRSLVSAWRIRVGTLRILYAILDDEQALVIGAIERRSERTYEDIEGMFGEE